MLRIRNHGLQPQMLKHSMFQSSNMAATQFLDDHNGLGTLISLPLEVRRLIWTYFTPTGYRSDHKRRPTLEKARFERWSMSILRASRQLYEEVSSTLYDKLELAIGITPLTGGLTELLITTNTNCSWSACDIYGAINPKNDSAFLSIHFGALGFGHFPFHKLRKLVLYIEPPLKPVAIYNDDERVPAYEAQECSRLHGIQTKELCQEVADFLLSKFAQTPLPPMNIFLGTPAGLSDMAKADSRPYRIRKSRLGSHGKWHQRAVRDVITILGPFVKQFQLEIDGSFEALSYASLNPLRPASTTS